ncbi:MAG: exodeoxyribonuclease VII large subunit [Verrucomicrobia bacterium]|jgi:exodeoxyribonuclease VII large subunit|nr:exodeoxyribonuclease VII large subunit [Verrucomicrobiota bacterium]
MLDNLLAPSPEEILKVTTLTRLIKGQLEENFSRVWVQGEVSNLRRQSSGHVYFSLKDAKSQLPCALFARDAARQSFELENGMELLLLGDISVFEPHGRYQLIAKVAIQSGAGRLQMEFERLKRKLAGEGLFDRARKKALPVLPQRIAVITSPTGAAVRDFLRILHRRRFGGEIVIFPARVQGRGAAEEVISMLAHASASPGFDLVVLTRGGGSIEDLWAFNEESLARAVAACPLPTVSAIGHEIDTVLTDYAADRRAETPSGAAELISTLYLEALQNLEVAEESLHTVIQNHIDGGKSDLRELLARLRIIAPERQLQHLGMCLDDFENQLKQSLTKRLSESDRWLGDFARRIAEQHPKTRISMARQQLDAASRQLQRATALTSERKKEALQYLQQRLANGSLQATLKRGYTILQNPDGTILERSVDALKESAVRARFQDGEIDLDVRHPEDTTG